MLDSVRKSILMLPADRRWRWIALPVLAALTGAAEAGAAAASMSKFGFGGSLLTNMATCPQMQVIHLIVTPPSAREYISKDI